MQGVGLQGGGALGVGFPNPVPTTHNQGKHVLYPKLWPIRFNRIKPETGR